MTRERRVSLVQSQFHLQNSLPLVRARGTCPAGRAERSGQISLSSARSIAEAECEVLKVREKPCRQANPRGS